MSKLLADQIANYDDNGPIEIKEGLNIASGKPLQVAGSAGSNGNVLVSSGTTVSWSNALDNSSNWDDAHGWGNHASAGYLTSVPALSLDGLSNVDATTGVANGSILKYNGSSWEAATDLNDNDNTTYVQSSQASGSNVNLRLTGSDATNDDILLTAGTNVTFSSVSVNGFTIDVAGTASSLAAVTAVGASTDAQVQFQNSGAFGVNILGSNGISTASGIGLFIGNISTNNWQCEISGTNGNIVSKGDITCNSLLTGNSSIAITDTGTDGNIAFNTDGTDRWKITNGGHIIPYTNAAFDIGNAEYKVRHLFLSDNTLYFEGSFLKVAQHDNGGSAQTASYLIPLAKLKDTLNASADYEAFKTAILAITDA
jgi:hypothetical protein